MGYPGGPKSSPVELQNMDASKQGGQLPLPTGIARDQKSLVFGKSRLTFGAIAILFILWQLQNAIQSFLGLQGFSEADDDIAVFLKALGTEGMGWAMADAHEKWNGYEKPSWQASSVAISPVEAERIFLQIPNNDSAAAASRRYTSYAHPAGSGYDHVSALNLKNEWERELGFGVSGPEEFVYDAGSSESQERVRNGMNKPGVWIDTYYPVMNTPVHASVSLLTDPPFHAKLREDIVEGDEDSQLRDEVPVFHGLSISGNVTAKYIYAGYGRKKDFDLLQSKGIDFTGKIVLAKYGGCFRGLKVKAAQEAGAVGVIVFTDPGDDGEFTEENGYQAYPKGPARQPSSVQRGSVQFISKYPGDPSTPGEPAYKNASRVEGGNRPSIPSIPMSYEDVIPILKALEGKGFRGKELGSYWAGGLEYYGVDYYTGPSDVDLRFVNEVNTRIMPIWNTMAVIPGHITDEVIILGNHRDAWVLGGSDPNSGTTSQYEVIRGLGALLRRGWKPLRTIILASWDAEEYGLIGSTEWAEDFGNWLQKNVVAYLNMDMSVSGSNFRGSASPSLALLVRSAAEEIESSINSSRSVYSTIHDAGDWNEFRTKKVNMQTGNQDTLVVHKGEKRSGISALGSGSDYTPFLQRYGIASSDIGYKAGPRDPVYHYHSVYDSFTWQKQFGDIGFHRHTDAAKVIGLMLLRLTDSLILPLNTTQYTYDLKYYLKEVEEIARSTDFLSKIDLKPLDSAIESAQKASFQLDQERHEAMKEIHKLIGKTKPYSLLERFAHKCRKDKGSDKSDVAQIHTWQNLRTKATNKKTEFLRLHLPFPLPTPDRIRKIKMVLRKIREINKKLQHFESGFLSEEGIKDREWYKHKGVAPGLWLGYGATTFPGLTEAITIDHSAALAQKEADELSTLINGIAHRLSA
nr:membrane protein [Cryptococcus depauperatus CBS 7855]